MKKYILFLAVFLMLTIFGQSQVTRSLYFMDHIPAANLINPSFTHEHKFYINVPVLSIYNSFESPLAFNDITSPFPSGDSLYIDRDKIIERLGDRNYFAYDNYTEILKAGVKLGKSHIHLSLNQVLSARIGFDQNLAKLGLYGNGHPDLLGQTTEIDDIGINLNLYHEIALGYSLQLHEKLTFGFRAKYLNGFLNFTSERMHLTVNTDDETNYALTVSSDILLRSATGLDQITNFKWYDYDRNHGYAFDFGLTLKPSERLKLGFSVVDIGRIRWQSNVTNYRSVYPGVEYTFEGFDISTWYVNDTINNSFTLLDSLQQHFQLEENYDAYVSTLTPKIYLGGQFYLTPRDDVGLLVKSELLNNRIHPSFTLNYQHRFGRFVAVQANYSIINRTFENVGLGASVKLGPIMVYAVTDRAWGIFKPQESMTYNLLLGATLLFGNAEKVVEEVTE